MAGTKEVVSTVDVGIVSVNLCDDKGQVVLYVLLCTVAVKSFGQQKKKDSSITLPC